MKIASYRRIFWPFRSPISESIRASDRLALALPLLTNCLRPGSICITAWSMPPIQDIVAACTARHQHGNLFSGDVCGRRFLGKR